MYLNDNATVFTSLCVGEEYRNRISTQIQSILKFTNHEAYIFTDEPDFFGTYYGPRIHFIKLDEKLTDLPLRGKQGQFNFNLKMIPMRWCMMNTNASITVYLDADTFLFGWTRLFARQFPLKSEGIWGRFRHGLNDAAAHNLIIDKLALMEIDATNISTRLPVENVLFLKQGPTMHSFFDAWYRYAKLAYEIGARTDFEGVELCLAIHETNLSYVHMDNETMFNVDDFRTLHHNVIHVPFVI